MVSVKFTVQGEDTKSKEFTSGSTIQDVLDHFGQSIDSVTYNGVKTTDFDQEVKEDAATGHAKIFITRSVKGGL